MEYLEARAGVEPAYTDLQSPETRANTGFRTVYHVKVSKTQKFCQNRCQSNKSVTCIHLTWAVQKFANFIPGKQHTCFGHLYYIGITTYTKQPLTLENRPIYFLPVIM